MNSAVSSLYSDPQASLTGRAELQVDGAMTAASHDTLTIVYTAGRFGLDDLGAIRVAWRNCSDMAQPQFTDPTGEGYTTAEASNGIRLSCVFDQKGGIRPFSKALTVVTKDGYLSPDDTITLRIGDKRFGSKGIRVQSAVEIDTELCVLADPFNTRDFIQLEPLLTFDVAPGDPQTWHAVLPSLRRVGQQFRLGIKANDAWGNPCTNITKTIRLQTRGPIKGVPDEVALTAKASVGEINGLVAVSAGEVCVEVLDEVGTVLAVSNPLRIVETADLVPYWGDLHWQSRETVGVGTIRDGLAFARDKAFIDITSHAANDLQMTDAMWQDFNSAFAEFDEPDRFVALPGYEWSGNTPLGGDRNVIFNGEGGTLRRSSRALVNDLTHPETDCHTAAGLFNALSESDEDVLTWAHVGGRHCDIGVAHDPQIETAIEVHSTYWGVFPWLIREAFENGYRVGFVSNSDDHKGRPGASAVGYSKWGNTTGLTCFMMPELTREALWEALKRRHHYGTSGGSRLHLDVQTEFATAGEYLEGVADQAPTSAMMGDIVKVSDSSVELSVDLLTDAPIQRLEIHNGLKIVETVHPYAKNELGNRLMITFEGAEFRGRMPGTHWDGELSFEGASIVQAAPVNFCLQGMKLVREGETKLKWACSTTGNLVGIEMVLDQSQAGMMSITTPMGRETIQLAAISGHEIVFDYGKLDRKMRIFRLPETNNHHTMSVTRQINLQPGTDNPLFVIVTLENGAQAWSSPIYLVTD